jgi:Rps23 Pro-64 3,4-dihydroxylase Tpa1-like proline 4-hydroxylase
MSIKIFTDEIEEIKEKFSQARPYGYANVGEMFSVSQLRDIAQEVEIRIALVPTEKNIYASYRKQKLSNLQEMPDKTRSFITYLNSNEFLQVLSHITGIDELYADSELLGGGIHAIDRGGFLKLHTDFNWHNGLSMHRRLNLLVYLNEGWQEDWNGRVELWNADAKDKIFSLSPSLGNALLFETSDVSFHGHPDPLDCPEGQFRKSIAVYYYSPSRPESEIRFGKSEMTNYVERPGEIFGKDRFRRFRHKIKLLVKKMRYALRKR